MTVGELIRALRKANGNMSQQKLVAMVKKRKGDLSQPQLSAIENDEVDSPSALPYIAGAFGMTYDEFMAAAKGKKSPPVVQKHQADTVEILELEVHAGAGMGVDGDGTILATQEASAVLGVHTMPTASFREAYGISAGRIRIIPVKGNSMEPKLWPGQRVMVDIEDKAPSPPGIFVVWDGLALVLKYVEVIPNSEPLRVRISSANTAFQAYERNVDEAHINGRVIGVWARM